MAVPLMHSSVPLRGRKGKTSDTHRQLHSLFDSREKNVTRGSSHQSEAARESKRPSQSLSTECSTEKSAYRIGNESYSEQRRKTMSENPYESVTEPRHIP